MAEEKKKETTEDTEKKVSGKKKTDTTKNETKETKTTQPKKERVNKAELDKVNEELISVKAKLADTSDKYLRVLAEYDNFRKRSEKEKKEQFTGAYVSCVKEMLPIIDNIERILTLECDEKFKEGLTLIVNSMHTALEKMGVKEIETKVFDPNVHNAIMHIEDESYGEGEIVEVFQKGYIYEERVIRYAMVKVAN